MFLADPISMAYTAPPQLTSPFSRNSRTRSFVQKLAKSWIDTLLDCASIRPALGSPAGSQGIGRPRGLRRWRSALLFGRNGPAASFV